MSADAYVTNQDTEYWAKEGWVQSREAFAELNEHGRSGDVVILYPQLLWSVNRYYNTVGGMNATLLVGSGAQIKATVDALQANASTTDQVWFVVYTYHGPQSSTEQYVLSAFNTTHAVSSSSEYVGYRVYLLTKRA